MREKGQKIITTEYRGYSICQQREFGPLRLLKWVEDSQFIIVKNNADVNARFHLSDH